MACSETLRGGRPRCCCCCWPVFAIVIMTPLIAAQQLKPGFGCSPATSPPVPRARGSSAAMEAALQAARQALATGEYKASLQHCKAALKAAKQEGKSAYDALCVSGSRAVRMLTKNCSHAVGHTAANSWLLHPLNPLHAMHPRMQPADWPSSDQDL